MTTPFLCRCGSCHCPLVVAPSTWAQCVQWHGAESLINLQWTWRPKKNNLFCGEEKPEIRGYLFISMACHLPWLRQSRIQPRQEDQLEQVWYTARCHSDLALFLLHSTHLLSVWIVTSGAHRSRTHTWVPLAPQVRSGERILLLSKQQGQHIDPWGVGKGYF